MKNKNCVFIGENGEKYILDAKGNKMIVSVDEEGRMFYTNLKGEIVYLGADVKIKPSK